MTPPPRWAGTVGQRPLTQRPRVAAQRSNTHTWRQGGPEAKTAHLARQRLQETCAVPRPSIPHRSIFTTYLAEVM